MSASTHGTDPDDLELDAETVEDLDSDRDDVQGGRAGNTHYATCAC